MRKESMGCSRCTVAVLHAPCPLVCCTACCSATAERKIREQVKGGKKPETKMEKWGNIFNPCPALMAPLIMCLLSERSCLGSAPAPPHQIPSTHLRSLCLHCAVLEGARAFLSRFHQRSVARITHPASAAAKVELIWQLVLIRHILVASELGTIWVCPRFLACC
jgi:hypothetical protein